MKMPSLEEQLALFNVMRTDIDTQLRRAGLDDVLREHGLILPELDTAQGKLGWLVVARSYTYTTRQADIDIDLDPLAATMSVTHEVGIAMERQNPDRYGYLSRHYRVKRISHALVGEEQEPAGELGNSVNLSQIAVVEAAIDALLSAKRRRELPSLTKSLLKIDPAGD